MVEVKNVCYKYKNGEVVLEDINIKIEEGETLGVIR